MATAPGTRRAPTATPDGHRAGRHGGPTPAAAGRAGRWTPASIPEQLGLLGLCCVAASFAYPPLHEAVGLRFYCPLRELTGVPCPVCGLTTASTALAGGDLPAAVAANPFVLLIAAGTAAMAVLMACRALGRAAPPGRWDRRAQRRTVLAVAVLAAASWAFQLHRYGLI